MKRPLASMTWMGTLAFFALGIACVALLLVPSFGQQLLGADDQHAEDPGQRVSHGVDSDVFDWSDTSADVPLDKAISRLMERPLLPREAVVGRPKRVLLLGEGQVAPTEVSLAILYDSGVKLFIEPGRVVAELPDYEERLKAKSNELPYMDDRAAPYTIQSINGRKTVVHAAGEMESKIRHGVVRSAAAVGFVAGTTQYTLIAGEHSVPLGTLIAAARSMK